jgi:polysaccharide biosynthesis protein PelF
MSDVCLILEGTYPYVTGGVSSCVHQLISGTPQINYTILYIGATRPEDPTYKYPVPSNVRAIKEVYLFEERVLSKIRPHLIGLNQEEILILKESLLFGGKGDISQLYRHFFHPRHRRFKPEEVFYSKELWLILEEVHQETFTIEDAPSFIDFFYTWRFSVYPIFVLFQLDLPRSQIYHAMCTGYAGLLGCLAKERTKRKFIITEHGIYTHERKIEISQSEWLQAIDESYTISDTLPYFKRWWYQLFEVFGKTSYQYADIITTLFGGNVDKQLELGAPKEKLMIISNGIKPPLDYKRANDSSDKIVTIALVGRVVMIKDIKTFIKAVSYIKQKVNNFEVLIIGPTEEEEAYFEECETLVEILGVKDKITFTGRQDMTEFYPKIDIMALTSISEGQPLVLLEAFSREIPVVATDVGACRELLFGRDTEDKALGPAGFIAPFGNEELIGKHLVELINNPNLRKQMGASAQERFLRYYQEKYYLKNYLNLYGRFI